MSERIRPRSGTENFLQKNRLAFGAGFSERKALRLGRTADRDDETDEDQCTTANIIEGVIIDAGFAIEGVGHVVADSLRSAGNRVFAAITEVQENAAESDKDDSKEGFIHDEAWDEVVVD